MAAYVKYESAIENIANKIIDFFGTSDTYKVALTNTAPNVATHTVRADITELSTANGYPSGGEDTANDSTRSSGTITETATDVVWTASGGSIGPFRYVVRYDDTPTSPADPLLNYWDYGSAVTLSTGETFTVDFGASVSTLA
jgi:hypothetical protein